MPRALPGETALAEGNAARIGFDPEPKEAAAEIRDPVAFSGDVTVEARRPA